MTVVETNRFLKDVRDLLSESEAIRLVSFIGANPQAGDVVPETGGVRKLRWSLPGRGKRGGARVIYYLRTATDILAGRLREEGKGQLEQS
jgi:mRNA-degrading endonuclease RelE of RelBE toxin-antitoxin system